MSSSDYTKILEELSIVKYKLKDMENLILDIEKDIRGEIDQKVQRVEWEHTNYDRRISFTEKIIFSTAGFILIAVLGALVASVMK